MARRISSISSEEISTFQTFILDWYSENKRDLPWRKTKDPYAIVVSEVMLQQTQVDRVVAYFGKWLSSFPDTQSLEVAEKKKVLAHWSGLGYNNRALRLQKLAGVINTQYKGNFPMSKEELLKLPGIGPYTAGALMAFAWNKDVAVVDTNIRRVFIDAFSLHEDLKEKDLETFALKLCPKGQSRRWYNALMDYGATVRTARRTNIRPTSKQSSFEGSDRQVRGYVTKFLLSNNTLEIKDLSNSFPGKDVQNIVEKMQKDGLIVIRDKEVMFS